MLASHVCPGVEVLQRLLNGQLLEPEAGSVGEHLLQCDRCIQTIQGLQGDDTLVESLRGGAVVAARLNLDVIQRLIERIEGLPRLQIDPGRADTAAERSARGASSEASDATRAPIDFLGPAQNPDELGRLGGYRVLKVLGQGGMGAVLLAEDTRLRRQVALKVMLPSLGSSTTARERFLREARAAAQLKHDHIVTIYQVDEDHGVPFVAMELLEGESLADRLKREGKLPMTEVLRIGEELADALQAAHDRGLIHRDVKPGNTWLEGTRGRVKVLDFGLARSRGDAQVTASGAIVGTPAYMSPEQARGESVDHRCDLFSLGVVLYLMATGEMPFKGNDTLSLLTALALDSPRSPRELNPETPLALDSLISRLLAKNAAERPPTAAAVAHALQLIAQTPEPAEPSPAPTPPIPPNRCRRWLTVAMGAFAVAGLVAGIVITLTMPGGEGTVRVETVDADIDVVVRKGGKEFTIFDRKTRQEVTLPVGPYQVVLKDDKGGRLVLETPEFTLKRGKEVVVRVRWRDRPPPLASAIPEHERWKEQPKELMAVFGDSRWRHSGSPRLSFSSDGKAVHVAQRDGNTLRVWDAATNRDLAAITLPPGTRRWAITRDNKAVVYLVQKRFEWTVEIYDVLTKKTRTALAKPGTWPYEMELSPDGKLLAVYPVSSYPVHVCDLTTGEVRLQLSPPAGAWINVAFSHDGKLLATFSSIHPSGSVLHLWDLGKGTERKHFKAVKFVNWEFVRVSFTSDDSMLIAYGESKVRRWDVATGKELEKTVVPPESPGWPVQAFGLSPDGRTLAYSHQSWIKLFETATGKEKKVLLGSVPRFAFYQTHAIAFSHDGNKVAAALRDGSIRLWDVTTGRQLNEVPGPVCLAVSGGPLLPWSPDGKTVVRWGKKPNVLELWDPTTGKSKELVEGARAWYFVAGGFSPDGRWVATYYANVGFEAVMVLDARADADPFTPSPNGFSSGMAFSPDSKTFARTVGNTIELVVTGAWKPRILMPKPIVPPLNAASTLCFSPDGQILASGGTHSDVFLWDAAAGKERGRLSFKLPPTPGVAYRKDHLAFSPDDKRLAAGGTHLQVWDLSTKTEILSIPLRHSDYLPQLRGLTFAPHGKTVITAGDDGRIVHWPLAGGKPTEWRLRGPVLQIGLTSDDRLLVANGNGTLSVFRLPPP